MRVLLLGTTGFAGAHFRHAGEQAGMALVAAGRDPRSDIVCDLLDPDSVERAIAEAVPDAIVNLAGAASVGRSFDQPTTTFEVNATGVLNLLEASARNAPDAHLLCVSSGEVYGTVDEAALPISERQPLGPVSPYGLSKAAMELICDHYTSVRGLRIAVIRAFNHTGPGQSDAFAASSFARQVAEAERDGLEEARLHSGDLTVSRDFSDVRDIVDAYRLVVERGLTGTFNACSGHPTRIGRLVDYLDRATPVLVHTVLAEERLRSGETTIVYGSAERLRQAGWCPRIPIEQTMRDLLEWWRGKVCG